MCWGGGYGGYFSGVGGSLLEQQILNQVKKLILAVMCTIKEIAIKPEKQLCSNPVQSMQIFSRLNRNFSNCIHDCEDHFHLISFPQFTSIIYHIFIVLSNIEPWSLVFNRQSQVRAVVSMQEGRLVWSVKIRRVRLTRFVFRYGSRDGMTYSAVKPID